MNVQDALPPKTARIRDALEEAGVSFELLPSPGPTRTAEQGAKAFGVHVSCTAPALVLEAEGSLVVWISSGGRGRVDLEEAARLLGVESLRLAPPGVVREATGYSPGTLPPVLHRLPCGVDLELLLCPRVYGGAGDPRWTLAVDPEALLRLNPVAVRQPPRFPGARALRAYLDTGSPQDRALVASLRGRNRPSRAFEEALGRSGPLPRLEVFAEMHCPDCAVLVPWLEALVRLRPDADLVIRPREGHEELLRLRSDEARIPTVAAWGDAPRPEGLFVERPGAVRERGEAAVEAYRSGAFAEDLERELLRLLGAGS